MSSEPFSLILGGKYGINPYKTKVERHLSDMKEYFLDKRLVEEMLSKGEDPLIYTVYEMPREKEGEFNVSCTIIYPGKIGKEYYFTKGHFHAKEPTSEIYIGMKGEGLILMQNRRGETRALKIEPNVLVYIPPGFAHRSVNTGNTELVFLAIYPSDAGHDYVAIQKTGFAKIVVEENGKPTLADNPKYSSQA
ncbi:glucose-6-phosphate isomerase [Candidatus Bathyarchaeota archaeon]|nr:glucose-6-phosphate isomerase [Candidatus Bathyarchaeota archaeon]